MSEIPDELPRHDGPRCSYACWSVSPREVSNATAYGVKPNSRWARESHQVDLVAGVILGCSCDDDGLCKHIGHVLLIDTRGCIQYSFDIDADRVHALKAFTQERRKDLSSEVLAAQ